MVGAGRGGERRRNVDVDASRRQSMRPRGFVSSVDREKVGRVSFYSDGRAADGVVQGARGAVGSMQIGRK